MAETAEVPPTPRLVFHASPRSAEMVELSTEISRHLMAQLLASHRAELLKYIDTLLLRLHARRLDEWQDSIFQETYDRAAP